MFAFSVAFTTWTLHTVQADVRSSVVDTQRALVRTTAGDVDEKIELRRDALKTIAGLFAGLESKPAPQKDAFFEARPVSQKLFDGLLVVDRSGQVTYDLPHGSARSSMGSTVAGRDFFKRILDGSPLVISSPFKSLANGEPALVFASPIRSADGRVTGALLGSLNLTHANFLSNLGRVSVGEHGYLVVIERSDKALFVMHRQTERIGTIAPGGGPIMEPARRGLEGSVEGVNADGIETLRTFIPLKSVPWVLLAVYPTAEAFTGLRARQREAVWGGGALFLVASGLAWLMSGWLLRPLARLRAEMDRTVADSGGPMAPATFGSAEVAALVLAYNAQASRRREFEDRVRGSEKRMRDITDNVPAMIAHIDSDGRYTFANVFSEGVLGSRPGTLPGRHMRDVRSADAYAEIAGHVAKALRGEAVTFEGSGLLRGKVHQYQANYTPDRDDSGRIRGFYSMLFDITPLEEARALQMRVEARLRAITDNLPVLITHVDRDERHLFLNATFKSWLGIDPAAAIGRTMADVIPPPIYARRREQIQRCLAGERVSFEDESNPPAGRRDLHTDYIPEFGTDGSVCGFYTLVTDVTELKAAQRQLAMLVRSDTLTGLPNRYRFNETLPLALARCARSGLALGLMFIDIDQFKGINDTFGHAAGDSVLKEFSQRLRRSVRTTDMVARLGGDEFVIILEGLHGEEEPRLLAGKVLSEIDRPFDIDGRMLEVTTSIGVAFHRGGETNAPDILALADAALYEAKASGRNAYRMSSG